MKERFVSEEKLLEWERIAAWEKPEGREALRQAIDEIRQQDERLSFLMRVANAAVDATVDWHGKEVAPEQKALLDALTALARMEVARGRITPVMP